MQVHLARHGAQVPKGGGKRPAGRSGPLPGFRQRRVHWHPTSLPWCTVALLHVGHEEGTISKSPALQRKLGLSGLTRRAMSEPGSSRPGLRPPLPGSRPGKNREGCLEEERVGLGEGG